MPIEKVLREIAERRRYPCGVCGLHFTRQSDAEDCVARHRHDDARELRGAMETAQEALNPLEVDLAELEMRLRRSPEEIRMQAKVAKVEKPDQEFSKELSIRQARKEL